MNDTVNMPITVTGKKLLDEELKKLLTVERPAILQAIDEARALGDLKENAEYHAAKERQSFIEGRIQHINGLLSSAQVINPAELHFDFVVFGATVTMEDMDSGATLTYQIVGADEADIAKSKISIGSPIARALIKRKEGDEVPVKTPKGNVTYAIQKIEYK